MIKVSVKVDETTYSTVISSQTHTWLRDGAYLRGHPIEHFLYHVVKIYGAMTEENILKFMDEKWIL